MSTALTESHELHAPPARRGRALVSLLVPLVVYALVTVPMALRHLEKLNTDGVVYIRRAMYLVAGNFEAAVSGYWAPLISWTMAPLIGAGVDGVHAARLVMCLWGAALLVAFWVFLRTFTRFSETWRLAAGCTLAVCVSPWAVRQITPDVALATCLLLYFSASVSDRLLKSYRWALLTGTAGGLAYLSKSYALPVVLVHLPATLLLRKWATGKSGSDAGAPTVSYPRLAATLGLGLVGFAVVAGPWIGVLSNKHGRFTFSTSGKIAHALVGPHLRGVKPMPVGLTPDPFIEMHENPETYASGQWSPWQSAENFDWQLKVIGQKAPLVVKFLGSYDLLKLVLVALPLGLLLATGIVKVHGERWRLLWLVGTIALFSGGFAMVWVIRRYFIPVALPLGIVLCLKVAMDWRSRREKAEQDAGVGPLDWVRRALGAIVLLSFLAVGANEVRSLLNRRSTPIYRQLANILRKHDISGPLTSSDRERGFYVAHHLNAKFSNFPGLKHPDKAHQQLLEHKVRYLILWNLKSGGEEAEDAEPARQRIARELVERNGWVERLNLKKANVKVYESPAFATTRPAAQANDSEPEPEDQEQ